VKEVSAGSLESLKKKKKKKKKKEEEEGGWCIDDFTEVI
jgi:hypothetical protein